MALKSKVGRTTSGDGTASLRTSVPQGAAAYMGVKAGDYVYWNMAAENDERIIIIRTAEHQEMQDKFERRRERMKK